MAKVCLPGRPGDSSMLHGDPSLFLSRVWEMCQEDGPFCDLQLQFGDETQQGGNSLVLAALSPFFEAMLTTEMKEKTGRVVQLPTISQHTFRQVLAFSLGREVGVEEREMVVEEREAGVEEREMGVEEREVGVEEREVGVEEREVGVEERELGLGGREVGVEERDEELVEEREKLEELLQAADMLQLWHLKNACGEALADRLTMDNCLDTLKLVHKFSLDELKRRVEKYTSACLGQVYESPNWVTLKEAEVSGIIRAGGLCDSSMDTKAAAALRWLQENQADVDATSRLVGLLSLEELPFDFLVDSLLMHPCVLQCPSVLQAVKECMKAKAAAGTKQEPICIPLVQACVEPAPVPVSYVFIFNNHNDRLEICEWLTKEQVWVNCLEREETLLSCAPEACSGQVILSTKFMENNQTYSKFLHYSVKGRTISYEGVTMSGLSHLAGAVGDLVFVVERKDISRYDVKSKCVGNVGSLLVGVSNPGVAVMGDFLVVVGGSGDNDQNNLIQTFHTKTYKASVSAHRLPKYVNRLTFAGHHQGRSYFLGSSGNLVGLVERQGEVMVDTHVQLQDLQNRTGFTACIEGDGISLCGGTSFVHCVYTSITTVATYELSGQRREMSRIPSLCKGMYSCHIIPMY